MVIPTFPTPAQAPGIAFPTTRVLNFSSIVHTAVAGQSVGQAMMPYPTISFELPYDFLRSDNAHAELQLLTSVYELCQGRANPFHYQDPNDKTATGAALGTGDGVTTVFPFARAFGSAIMPVQDVDTGSAVIKLNGVTQGGGTYTILSTSQYATIYAVQFNAAPGVGVLVTADFTYKWLCRFDQDSQEFAKIMSSWAGAGAGSIGIWETKSVKFTSFPQ